MSVEAMKQALKALNNTDTHPISSAEQYFKETQAMEALEDAIDDAEEQKPVAWGMVRDGEIYDCITPAEHDREQGEYTVPLYAAPPQPSTAYYLPNEGHARVVWVGLTDEEIHALADECLYDNLGKKTRVLDFARAIEGTLKEKNHAPKPNKDLCGND